MTDVPAEAKQPQDHQPKAEPAPDQSSEPYIWTAPDGRKVTFTAFKELPVGVFRKARGLDEIEQTFIIMEAGTDAVGLDVLDELPIGDLDAVFKKWAAASGVEYPES